MSLLFNVYTKLVPDLARVRKQNTELIIQLIKPSRNIFSIIIEDNTKYISFFFITDNNMKKARIKLFEFTTFQNANILTAEMPMHECSAN